MGLLTADENVLRPKTANPDTPFITFISCLQPWMSALARAHTGICAVLAACSLLLLAAVVNPALADSENRGDEISADEMSIRDARERFNEAIKRQDIEAIVSFFLPDYHIVTGRSDQVHGVENEARHLTRLFADDPTFVCHRSTREVRVNTEWGLAEELGNWRCNYTADSESIESSGTYAAKWQRTTHAQWLLQSEVFTTLQCQGGEKGCRPPDPVE